MSFWLTSKPAALCQKPKPEAIFCARRFSMALDAAE
jgi:hypothetical protein